MQDQGETGQLGTARVSWRAGEAERIIESRESRLSILLISPAFLWVFAAVVLPLATVIYVSFWRLDGFRMVRTIDPGAWTRVITDPFTWQLAGWTIQVTIMVLVAVGTIGTVCGYFLARHVRNPRFQILLLFLAILPFWTSYVIRIITWLPLFGRRGVLNYILQEVELIDEPLGMLLYSPWSMMVAMSSIYVVFVIGPVYWAFSRIDPDTITAARTLGASPWRVFWTIELPLAKGGIVAGLFFASIFLFGDFATERIIGGGSSPMLAGTISRYADSIQWNVASVLAILLTVMALAFLALLMRIHNLRRDL